MRLLRTFAAKVVVAIVASLESATVRERGEKRTAFHPVATFFAVAVARNLLRARETEITEVANCGHRRGRRRRRD